MKKKIKRKLTILTLLLTTYSVSAEIVAPDWVPPKKRKAFVKAVSAARDYAQTLDSESVYESCSVEDGNLTFEVKRHKLREVHTIPIPGEATCTIVDPKNLEIGWTGTDATIILGISQRDLLAGALGAALAMFLVLIF